MKKVNLTEELNLIDEYWSPKIVGELNNQLVKLAKLKGEFISTAAHELNTPLASIIGYAELLLQSQPLLSCVGFCLCSPLQ